MKGLILQRRRGEIGRRERGRWVCSTQQRPGFVVPIEVCRGLSVGSRLRDCGRPSTSRAGFIAARSSAWVLGLICLPLKVIEVVISVNVEKVFPAIKGRSWIVEAGYLKSVRPSWDPELLCLESGVEVLSSCSLPFSLTFAATPSHVPAGLQLVRRTLGRRHDDCSRSEIA